MDTQHKNIMFLVLKDIYVGTKIYLKDEDPKIIKDILDYDSLTHVFHVEFTNGDRQQISDKTRFKVEFADADIHEKVKQTPNKIRGKRI